MYFGLVFVVLLAAVTGCVSSSISSARLYVFSSCHLGDVATSIDGTFVLESKNDPLMVDDITIVHGPFFPIEEVTAKLEYLLNAPISVQPFELNGHFYTGATAGLYCSAQGSTIEVLEYSDSCGESNRFFELKIDQSRFLFEESEFRDNAFTTKNIVSGNVIIDDNQIALNWGDAEEIFERHYDLSVESEVVSSLREKSVLLPNSDCHLRLRTISSIGSIRPMSK